MKKITYGMVGGSLKAFIGEVHRKALNFDPRAALVCGCFSSKPETNQETGKVYSLAEDRIYSDYKVMAEREGQRKDKIDFVIIVTPNHLHYGIAKAFLEQGIHVVCEKPLCFEIAEARELVSLAKSKHLMFAVTHAYTGYTMVKVMREMIAGGEVGDILTVNGEYLQDWLLNSLSEGKAFNPYQEGQGIALASDDTKDSKISVWRMDPMQTGSTNCVGDIGTHIENMVAYVTGLKIQKLLAVSDSFSQALDMNATILVEYENKIKGSYWCSQIAGGMTNGLKIRVYGTKGSLVWEQLKPDELLYTPTNEGTILLTRGSKAVKAKAGDASRLPPGHPEGVYVAFANMYSHILDALVEDRKIKSDPHSLAAGVDWALYDFPKGEDGLSGVVFIQAVVESASQGGAWVEIEK